MTDKEQDAERREDDPEFDRVYDILYNYLRGAKVKKERAERVAAQWTRTYLIRAKDFPYPGMLLSDMADEMLMTEA